LAGENTPKLLETRRNGLKWPEMARNGQDCPEIAGKRQEMVGNGRKWEEMPLLRPILSGPGRCIFATAAVFATAARCVNSSALGEASPLLARRLPVGEPPHPRRCCLILSIREKTRDNRRWAACHCLLATATCCLMLPHAASCCLMLPHAASCCLNANGVRQRSYILSTHSDLPGLPVRRSKRFLPLTLLSACRTGRPPQLTGTLGTWFYPPA